MVASLRTVQVDILVGGFPCVSVSHLTSTPGSVVAPNCSSGNGYLGLEAYVKWRKPSLIVIENVGPLFEKRKVEKDGESGSFAHQWTMGNFSLKIVFAMSANFFGQF